ncbi:MAG: hypothetical protein IT238_06010 [Bacteroidia bacterium]|nr:hypothetical protein [Bacteroidia bacterium]
MAKTQENSSPQTEQKVSNTSTTQNDKKMYRFRVSFISKGAGIDYNILEKYNTFIKEYETRTKTKVTFSEARWGREGEIDYCFDFANLDTKIAEDFIQKSKEVLRESDRINIGENTNCRGVIKEQE